MVAENGSKSATLHWIMQRVTAILLIPLSLQLIVFLDFCLNTPYQTTLSWLQKPLNILGLGLWFIVVLYHSALGLQVVIEDYIGETDMQKRLIKIVNSGCAVLALLAIVAVIRIA